MFKASAVTWVYRGENCHPFLIDPKKFLYKFKRIYADSTTWVCNTTKPCSGSIIERKGNMRYSTPHSLFCEPDEMTNEVVRSKNYTKALCQEKTRRLSYSEVYSESSRLFAKASLLHGNSYKELAPSIVRWSRPMNYALTKTITELNELLKNPEWVVAHYLLLTIVIASTNKFFLWHFTVFITFMDAMILAHTKWATIVTDSSLVYSVSK